MHKAGFVNIIGRPNVGKSTLMNALVGEKLSIITQKAQTTRHRIKGIVNAPEYQVVFSDTPGILDSAYLLHEKMMNSVNEALSDADLLLYMVEAGEKRADIPENIRKALGKREVPLFLVISKIDKSTQQVLEETVDFWKKELGPDEIIPISATEKFNLDQLMKRIIEMLPESPPFFDKEALTDRPERFFVSEIIREKIFLHYQKEIPYSCEVVIESFKEEETINRIRAVIYVERDSQKGILIGHKGEALKRVGTEARIEIEKFLEKKAFLELFVKVREDWRNQKNFLRNFGYDH
jgi:GTPase